DAARIGSRPYQRPNRRRPAVRQFVEPASSRSAYSGRAIADKTADRQRAGGRHKPSRHRYARTAEPLASDAVFRLAHSQPELAGFSEVNEIAVGVFFLLPSWLFFCTCVHYKRVANGRRQPAGKKPPPAG